MKLSRNTQLFAFFGLWILTTAYIALLPTRHYTPDAINYLLPIETHNVFELWHTQHLLGLFPGYVVYSLAGGVLRAWQSMRLVNAIMAGATVALAFLTLTLLTRKLILSAASALLLWFSYGFWHFSSDSEIYSIGLLSVSLLMLVYTAYMLQPTTRRVLLLGVVASFSILAHQLNLEFAGLICLSLVWLAIRPNLRGNAATWRHVALYGICILTIVPVVYGIGWLSVRSYLAADQTTTSFGEWALRYFGMSRSGQANWGGALHLNALPSAGYGILVSWSLPPIARSVTLAQGLLLGMTLVGALIIIVHSPFLLRRLPVPQRIIALVCGLTIVANSLSGWWWQAGNLKFLLFMQIPIVILIGLYANEVFQEIGPQRVWPRRLGIGALGLFATGLIGVHVLFTLPYETRGGIFAVAETAGVGSKSVWFDEANFATEYSMISASPGHALPSAFCQLPPDAESLSRAIWVVNEQKVANCPALSNAAKLGDFQTDRSRDLWGIYAVGALDATQP